MQDQHCVVSDPLGDPAVLPGRQQKYDIFRSVLHLPFEIFSTAVHVHEHVTVYVYVNVSENRNR